MENKATIFPYSKDDVQIFRYSHLIKEFKPVCPVAPSGWGENGMDATTIDGGQPIGCKITVNLENALAQTDILVVTSFKQFHEEKDSFDVTLKVAAEKGKEVIILELPQDYDQVTLSALKGSGIVKKVYPETSWLPKYNSSIRQKINIPVILVFGEGPSTNKFELQLALRKELLQRNYRVAQIGSRNYAELFGMHSFPAFMSSQFSEAEKIIRLNQYLKFLEATEKPDIIVIGVPQGIVPITEELHNDFGILLFEVAMASEPFFCINSLYHFEYPQEFFELKSEYTYGKLGCEVGCFVISNTWLDFMDIKAEKQLRMVQIRKAMKRFTNSINLEMGIPVISLYQPEAIKEIVDAVIAKINNYAQVDFI